MSDSDRLKQKKQAYLKILKILKGFKLGVATNILSEVTIEIESESIV